MAQAHAKSDPGANGHAIRSYETQARMIETAIEIFGAVGYGAASTRTLAERAGVNLAAIPYHFGSKRGLYLAAARAIAVCVGEEIDSLIAHLRNADGGDPGARIDEGIKGFFRVIVSGTEPRSWLAFFLRCEQDNDDAFRILLDAIVTRFALALRRSIAEVVGCEANDETLRTKVAVVLASIIGFRALRNTTLSILGWDAFNRDRLQLLDQTIRDLARAEFLAISNGTRAGEAPGEEIEALLKPPTDAAGMAPGSGH